MNTKTLQAIGNAAQAGDQRAVELMDRLFSGITLKALEGDTSDFVFQNLVTLSYTIPKGTGTESYLRRPIYNEYDVQDFEMFEDIAHDGLINHGYVSRSFDVRQYGFRSQSNEYVDNFYDVNYFGDEIARHVRQTEDFRNQLARREFLSTSIVYFAGAKTAITDLTIDDKIKHEDIQKIAQRLENKYIKPHEKFNGLYACVIHKDLKYTLRFEDETYLKAMQIGQNNEFLVTGKIFMFDPIQYIPVMDRHLVDPAGKPGGNATVDVYKTLVIGAEAMIKCSIDGPEQFTAKLRPRGSDGDLYFREQMAVTKFWDGYTKVNPDAIVLYLSAGGQNNLGELEAPTVAVVPSLITASTATVTVTITDATSTETVENKILVVEGTTGKVIKETTAVPGTPLAIALDGLKGNTPYQVFVDYGYTYGGYYDNYNATGTEAVAKDNVNVQFITI